MSTIQKMPQGNSKEDVADPRKEGEIVKALKVREGDAEGEEVGGSGLNAGKYCPQIKAYKPEENRKIKKSGSKSAEENSETYKMQNTENDCITAIEPKRNRRNTHGDEEEQDCHSS